MKSFHRFLAIFLAMILMCSLGACAKKAPESAGESAVFTSQNTEVVEQQALTSSEGHSDSGAFSASGQFFPALDEGEQIISACVRNDRIYILTRVMEQSAGALQSRIYSMEADGSDKTLIVSETFTTPGASQEMSYLYSIGIQSFCVCSDGSVWYKVNDLTSPARNVVHADMSGNELASIDSEGLSSQLQFFDSPQIPNIGPKTFISTSIMIAMVVLSSLGVIPLLECAFLAAAAMLLLGCCTTNQAMKSINWEILMVFAGSVVLGLAIQKTGIAERLAFGILDVCGTNPIVVMTAICFVGTFITEFISNTAAGAMFFPIMYEAAEKLGYEPYPFLIALMISVSSSFATPIGSPTHMLVYTPGGYRFSDFMRIGILMNIIILAANIFIVNIIYPLTPLQ